MRSKCSIARWLSESIESTSRGGKLDGSRKFDNCHSTGYRARSSPWPESAPAARKRTGNLHCECRSVLKARYMFGLETMRWHELASQRDE
jgi:hypothetical protein